MLRAAAAAAAAARALARPAVAAVLPDAALRNPSCGTGCASAPAGTALPVRVLPAAAADAVADAAALKLPTAARERRPLAD